MHTTTHHRALWSILTAFGGSVLAVVVYIFTADVVWTVVPLLATLAAVRGLLRHRATDR
ncbi:MAG TPA: hypothetical protein VFI00_14430 [Kribbella sp.]|nr:hypothetical protein [Kribbella sp.]